MDTNTNNNAPGPEKREDQPKETVREVHHHHYHNRNAFFPRFFWGITVIFVGLILLAQSVGWINLDLGDFFARLWPVLIILVGLSILSRGGIIAGLISVIILLMVLFLVAAYVFRVPILGDTAIWRTRTENIAKRQVQEFNVGRLADMQSADITIRSGAGKVTVSGNGNSLVAGKLDSDFAHLNVATSTNSNTQVVELKTEGSWTGFGHWVNDLDVNLSPDVPTKLVIDSGAAKLELDLSNTRVTQLEGRTGASSVDLTMGDKVSSQVAFDAGASSVNIHLPKTVGARVVVQSGLSSRNFTDFRQVDRNTFVSENYLQAPVKVDITLRGGASSLRVDWK